MYLHVLGGGCSEEGYGRKCHCRKSSHQKREEGRMEGGKKRVEKGRAETDLGDKNGEEK